MRRRLPRSWGGYLIITALSALQGAQLSLVAPYLHSLDYPPAAIGALVAVSTVVSLLTRMPAGLVYRGDNARLLLAASLAILTLALAAHPLAVAPLAVFAVRALTGLAYGVATTVNFARFVDEQPPGPVRARAMGYYSTGIAVGYSLASFVVGFVVEGGGFGWAFLTGAGLVLTGLLGLLDRTPLAGPEPPLIGTSDRASPGDRRGPGGTTSSAATAGPPAAGRGTLGLLLVSPALLVLVLESFVLNAHWAFWNAWLPLYALAFGIGLADVGLTRTVFGVLNAISRPLGGGIVAQLGAQRLATAGLVVQCVLLMLLPAFPGLGVLLAVFAGIGVLRAVGIVANTVGVVDCSDALGLGRGRMAALFNTSSDLGILAGPAVGGLVAQVVGPVQVFVVVPLGMLLGYLAALAASHLAARRPRTDPAARV